MIFVGVSNCNINGIAGGNPANGSAQNGWVFVFYKIFKNSEFKHFMSVIYFLSNLL